MNRTRALPPGTVHCSREGSKAERDSCHTRGAVKMLWKYKQSVFKGPKVQSGLTKSRLE